MLRLQWPREQKAGKSRILLADTRCSKRKCILDLPFVNFATKSSGEDNPFIQISCRVGALRGKCCFAKGPMPRHAAACRIASRLPCQTPSHRPLWYCQQKMRDHGVQCIKPPVQTVCPAKSVARAEVDPRDNQPEDRRRDGETCNVK